MLSAAVQTLRPSSASAQADAEVLLAHVLHYERARLISCRDEPLAPQAQRDFESLLRRRAAGEPVAYLTGRKEFWSLDLAVTPEVLIPRPETELLVEWALERIGGRETGDGRPDSCRILELGTGSGAIALALAKELPGFEVVAAEISADALAVAKRNAERLGIKNIRFCLGDWFKALDSRSPPFDVIVSNPPYVAENDPHLAHLSFEPRTALVAGPDGLVDLRRIVQGARDVLKPGGWLLLEHGARQGEAVRRLLRAAGFGGVETRRDLAGLERATGGHHS